MFTIFLIRRKHEVHLSIIERLSGNYEVSSPKYNEICTTINELTSNKAAGADNIPSELITNLRKNLK
jgi:hypothetical protein